MNIICRRDILSEALTPALCTVSMKGTNQVLDCFLLTADKESGVLTVSGYDLEKGVKVTVSGEDIQIKQSGKIIINAAKFSSIIRNLPDGYVSVIAGADFSVTVSSSRSNFTMNGLDGETFPLMPELKGDMSFEIGRKILRSMISLTNFAVAQNNARPSLNGALFEIKDGGFNIVAVDGYRLALRRSSEGITSDGEIELSFIVPGKSLSELLKLIGEGDEPASIELTRKHVIITFDNIVYFSRLIESEFLDYRRTIKSDPKTAVVINAQEFAESVERASLLADDRQKSKVRLSFVKDGGSEGTLKVSSASLLGKVSDECGITIEGDDLEIGFNHRYLLDALKSVREEKILLTLESPTKSLVILPYNEEAGGSLFAGADAESSKFLYLVLPLRLMD